MSGPRTLRNFIAGEYADGRTDSTTDIVNPATGSVVATAPRQRAGRRRRGVRRAPTRPSPSGGARRRASASRPCCKIADAIEARADELIAARVREHRQDRSALTASEEIPPMVDQLRFFAGAARVLEGKAAGEYMEGHTSWVRREPIGVVGQVTPWNYPLLMAVWKIAPALAAGNTIVLKPADTTPETTLLLAEIASEFLPAGVLNVITGDRDTGRTLVEHPTPGMVAITGSVRAGSRGRGERRGQRQARAPRARRQGARRRLRRRRPRRGRARASRSPATSTPARTARPPPACSAAPGIHDDFVAALAEYAASSAPVGLPDDEDALFGPVNNANQLERVSGFIDRLPDARHGRRRRPPPRGPRRRASTSSPPLSPACARTTRPSRTRSSARSSRSSRSPTRTRRSRWPTASTTASPPRVWTKDFGRAMRMSARLDFGCVWINTHIPLVAEMPHGGFKRSGYGKDLSMYGFEDYTRIKHVMANIES